MSLKRSGNLARAWFYGLFALVLLGYQSVVVWHLMTVGDWGGLFNAGMCGFLPVVVLYVVVLLLADITLVAWPFALLARERTMRSLAVSDHLEAPVAARQPDLANALPPGGRLVLEHWRGRKAARGQVVAGIFAAGMAILIGTFLGELLVVPALRTFRDWVGQGLVPLLTQPPEVPTPLDWAALALPPVLTVLGVVSFSISSARARWQRITADETGLTIEGPMRRPRAIPWSDVLVFARTEGAKPAKPDGTYLLWGREHLLEFTIHGKVATTTMRANPTAQWEYAGGYERYAEDASRLLATICARASVPLRTMVRAEHAAASVKRRFPRMLELDDALAAPLAGPPLQPSPGAVAAARSLSGQVALRPRLPRLTMTLDTLLVAVGAVLLLLLLLLNPPFPMEPLLHASDPALLWELLAIIAFGSLMFGAMGWGYAYIWCRRRAPIVIADEVGLTVRNGTSNKNVPSTIRWGDLRAWGVVTFPPERHRSPLFVVWAEGSKLTWVEPDGAEQAGRRGERDPRDAYREQAEHLHALIVARSGHALRALDLATPPADG